MKTDNILQQKSFVFAIRIVNLYKYLISEKKEFVLSKQQLGCEKSIGANVDEIIFWTIQERLYSQNTSPHENSPFIIRNFVTTQVLLSFVIFFAFLGKNFAKTGTWIHFSNGFKPVAINI